MGLSFKIKNYRLETHFSKYYVYAVLSYVYAFLEKVKEGILKMLKYIVVLILYEIITLTMFVSYFLATF